MIPKKIHYCWFGGNALPEDFQKYLESWKKYCPGYEIIQWDETNYDVTKNAYVREAVKSKKWAFLSDYARLDVVYQEGGIYLDTDVELLRCLDPLLECTCFMGMEQVGTVATGLGFGAEAGHPFLGENMRVYEESNYLRRDGSFRPEVCVKITTRLLQDRGLMSEDRIQNVGGVRVYPVEYFCPLRMGTKKLKITPNTYSIHHYSASWFEGNALIRKIKFRLIPVKVFIKKLFFRRKI